MRVHVSLTLFLTRRDAVGWTTVRGTRAEHRRGRLGVEPILDGPVTPTRMADFEPSEPGLVVSSHSLPRRFGGVLGVLLKAAGSNLREVVLGGLTVNVKKC